MKRANDNMKQIRSDELWGNYSIAGESAASKRRHGSLRRATLAVFAGLLSNKAMESQKQIFKSAGVMNRNYGPLSALVRSYSMASRAVF